MQLSHTPSAVFDERNLVSSAGLVPLVGLAQKAGLLRLADEWITVPADKGANPGLKVSSLVAGMAVGADSIDDMDVLRHGGMGRVFDHVYAPSTLGSFLRAFTFGHVRQLDAVASRFLTGLASVSPVLAGIDDYAVVDIDDTIREVYGHAKQGAAFGYNGKRGLDAFIATVSTKQAAPVVIAQRLRRGNAFSARGAKRLVADALATVTGLGSAHTRGRVLVRADSAFYGYPTVSAAIKVGAEVSVTVKQDAKIRTTIAGIDEAAWTKIDYPNPVPDPDTGELVSRAEVAETPFTAFTGPAKHKRTPVPGRLIVRRIPDLRRQTAAGQDELFTAWRYHAFFTTTSGEHADTVAADKTHRAHAIIEQVICDLKNSALAHLPSGKFTANAAWLVCAVIAFNLTRAAATVCGHNLARATTATIRRKIINVPARIANSARRIQLHLPQRWPWRTAWHTLFTATCGPPAQATT